MTKFSTDLSLRLAKLCEISYIDEDIAGKLKRMGFDLLQRIGKSGDLSGFVCCNSRYAVLVFQGTDPRDWQTIKEDLKFWKTKKDQVRYVQGFSDAYEELLPGFSEFVKTCDVPLYITGHSLGGAIALITAMRASPGTFEACYTFGAPRVCGISGEKLDDNKSIFRVINSSDVVPSLPLLVMGNWPFIGKLYYITGGYKLISGYRAYVMRVFGQAWPIATRAVFGLAGFLKNHPIDKYVDALSIVAMRERRAREKDKEENHVV
jgi:hypothetical protein